MNQSLRLKEADSVQPVKGRPPGILSRRPDKEGLEPYRRPKVALGLSPHLAELQAEMDEVWVKRGQIELEVFEGALSEKRWRSHRPLPAAFKMVSTSPMSLDTKSWRRRSTSVERADRGRVNLDVEPG